MDHGLLDILACPACKSDVVYRANEAVLLCKAERLAFPVREGIPVMLVDEARSLSTDELSRLLAS
ncbi:MAG: Trm112 family protein [Gammaproteobacteria bacterium]|nr:Trm112 family protein [Gammaproteobacteria bacterium]NNF15746.1 Trm112 family protein [Gammaproteobacteria bacterium]